ncbi:hypothetical protein HJG60_010682 [Phyllostomus discolor]|uniref:Uncharacterized protein n=1 Tax=Phyllostomus discolor TaxID=89673 RepID=A0A834APA7_9CHIR|nr:hypothetical protein HJG60_010682 [Phyllostomus discolor]
MSICCQYALMLYHVSLQHIYSKTNHPVIKYNCSHLVAFMHLLHVDIGATKTDRKLNIHKCDRASSPSHVRRGHSGRSECATAKHLNSLLQNYLHSLARNTNIQIWFWIIILKTLSPLHQLNAS